MIDTTMSTMLEWRRRGWDDECKHERMVPFHPHSFRTILLEINFRDCILAVFTAVTDNVPGAQKLAFLSLRLQDGKRACDVQIVWWPRVDAVVRHHSHDKRLYSLGLGEAKGQSAANNRVF